MAGNNGGNSLKLAQRLERRLKRSGWHSVIHTAKTWDEYTHAVVQAVRERPYALVVFGGDGSIRMAASRVARAKGLLGIVPCGRFNNIFRSLYGHTEAEAAFDLVTSGHQIRIDAALANGQFFVGSLVTGLLPVMIDRLGPKKLPRLAMHAANDHYKNRFIYIQGATAGFECASAFAFHVASFCPRGRSR
jgi:diacylglycerol kinase family enzyme